MTFTIAPNEVRRLLGEAGMAVVRLATGAQLTQRCATGGRHCDDNNFLVSARNG